MKLKRWKIKNELASYSDCYCNIKPPSNSEVVFVKEEALFICMLRYWKRFISFIRYVLLQSINISTSIFAIIGYLKLENEDINYSLSELINVISIIYIIYCVIRIGIDITKDMWNETNSFLCDRQLKLFITILTLEITKLLIKGKKITINNIVKCGFFSLTIGIICCLVFLTIFIVKFVIMYRFNDAKIVD